VAFCFDTSEARTDRTNRRTDRQMDRRTGRNT